MCKLRHKLRNAKNWVAIRFTMNHNILSSSQYLMYDQGGGTLGRYSRVATVIIIFFHVVRSIGIQDAVLDQLPVK